MKRMHTIILVSLVLLIGGCKYDITRIGQDLKTANTALFGVSDEEEQAIGREAAATLLGASPLLSHRETQQYVSRVGLWVAQQSVAPDRHWRFGVIENENINAFAAPDGYIFVTTGLLKQLRSEAELAGVLGHEIAHVVKEHHLNELEKGARLTLATRVAEESLRERGHDPGKYGWVIEGTKNLYTKGLSRDDELDADRLGVVLAVRAGYEPWGFVSVLQRLDALSREDSRLALLFKTHPSPADRLEVLGKQIPARWDAYAGLPKVEDRFKAQMTRWANAR